MGNVNLDWANHGGTRSAWAVRVERTGRTIAYADDLYSAQAFAEGAQDVGEACYVVKVCFEAVNLPPVWPWRTANGDLSSYQAYNARRVPTM